MTQDRLQSADWFRAIVVALGYVTCRFVAWLSIDAAFGVTAKPTRYEMAGLFAGGLIAWTAVLLLFIRRRHDLGAGWWPIVFVPILMASWPIGVDARGLAHLAAAAVLTAGSLFLILPRTAGAKGV